METLLHTPHASNQKHRHCEFGITLTHTIYKFLDTVSVGNLYREYHLINGVFIWSDTFHHMTFPGNTLWCTTVQLKYQPLHKLWSLSLDEINLVKGQLVIYRPDYIFRKGQMIKLIKSLPKFVYQSIPNVSFNFISCQKNCKYVATSSSKVAHAHTFQILSIELSKCFHWISKYIQKILGRSENINKM